MSFISIRELPILFFHKYTSKTYLFIILWIKFININTPTMDIFQLIEKSLEQYVIQIQWNQNNQTSISNKYMDIKLIISLSH